MHLDLEIVKSIGNPRGIHPVLRYGIILLAAVCVLELILPVNLLGGSTTPAGDSGDTVHRSGPLKPSALPPLTSIITRKGLFKPSTPVADKPMADKTIERIKSQLKLQCVMTMKGEPVAYINITGVGLRQCKVGESVQDLFTVVGITNNNVDVTIVGHKVSLSL